MDKLVDDADVNATLDLVLSTSSDVRQHPACLLTHRSLRVINDSVKTSDEAAVHYTLCLIVITSENIANGSKTWNDD